MAIYGESLTIQYIAWDTVNNVPKTGDASNHTLRWVKDGTAAAPTNSPSEVDATNAPGVYKVTLTATETQCWVGTLCGKSSTSGVAIMPLTLTFERLPTAAPGSSGGLPVIGAAPLTNLDATVSSRSTLTAADVWSYTNRQLSAFSFSVTVGGYASGQSPSEQLQATGYTSTRAARLDNLDVSVSSRLAAAAYSAPDNAGIAAIKAKTDQLEFVGTDVKATLDGETVTVSVNNDKSGYSLTSDYDRAKNALSYTEYTAPDNNSILAIKAKTDKLTFDENNNVYAIATVAIDEQSLAQAIAQELGSLTYIVQPLEVSIQSVAPEGGTITGFTRRKLRASWFTQTNVSGLNLEIILYDISNTIVAHYLGSEITVTQSGEEYLINLEGDSSKTPTEGSYYYAVCDLDTDNVLFIGKCYIYMVPQL